MEVWWNPGKDLGIEAQNRLNWFKIILDDDPQRLRQIFHGMFGDVSPD